MKTTYYILVLFVSIFNATLEAQTKYELEDIQGTWSFNYEASISHTNSKAQSHLENISTSHKNRIASFYKGRVLSFGQEGNYIQRLANGRAINGQWNIGSNGKTIEITNAQGGTTQLQILSISGNTMVLKPNDLGKGKALISEWHLTKN